MNTRTSAVAEHPKARDARLKAHLKMRPPSKMGVICVAVTNRCDQACSDCTRLLIHQDQNLDMSVENFRLALRSLAGYSGTIAITGSNPCLRPRGGNPCLHPAFNELCRIFAEEIPDRQRRGLWTNDVLRHAELIKTTFGVSNLYAHGATSSDPLKDFGQHPQGDTGHAPLLAAARDMFEPVEMWERISRCDINQNWSASIVQLGEELRAYFCEVAASFDLARGENRGMIVTPGWWRRPLNEFFGQIDHFCPGCGVPGHTKKGAGQDGSHLDTDSTDTDPTDKTGTRKKRKTAPRHAAQTADAPEARTPPVPQPASRPPVPQPSVSTRPVATAPAQPRPDEQSGERPHIFVVTPYYQESLDVLRRCHESVLAQRVDARITHIMVADGHPRAEVDSWSVEHIRLPRAHGDNGNTPRAIGAMMARVEDADFIAWLGAGHWFYPDHLMTMLKAHRQTKANVVCAWREFYTAEGEKLPLREVDEEQLTHVDTNCYMIHRAAFELNDIWANMPKKISMICDRVFFSGLQHKKIFHCFTQRKTVAFTTSYAPHFAMVGRTPPSNARVNAYEQEKAYLLSADGIRETVDRLGFWPG